MRTVIVNAIRISPTSFPRLGSLYSKRREWQFEYIWSAENLLLMLWTAPAADPTLVYEYTAQRSE